MIRFRKPYGRIEEGIDPGAIIAFARRPHQIAERYAAMWIVQWCYTLVVDLWVVVLIFNWDGAESREGHESLRHYQDRTHDMIILPTEGE